MTTCCVVGLGYIGLPTAAVLARAGHRVIGVDVNAQVVDTVNEGLIHIVEPDLDLAVAESVASGSLSAQLTPAPADVFLIAVPTPFRSGPNGIPQPNIDYVLAAARAIAPVLRPGNLILLESTSPVGTTEQLAEMVEEVCVQQRATPHRLLPRACAPRTHPPGTDQQRPRDWWPYSLSPPQAKPLCELLQR